MNVAKSLTFGYDFMQEDYEKRRDKVVDALDIARRWVSDGPDVQNTFEHLLYDGLLKQRHQWRHSRYVYVNLRRYKNAHILKTNILLVKDFVDRSTLDYSLNQSVNQFD